MLDTLNREGLTFSEWVCAAGLAIIDQGLVRPYTYSYLKELPYEPPDWAKGTVLLICGTSRVPRGRMKREKVTFYPTWVRLAWKNGEDPTEYRARGITLLSKVRIGKECDAAQRPEHPRLRGQDRDDRCRLQSQ